MHRYPVVIVAPIYGIATACKCLDGLRGWASERKRSGLGAAHLREGEAAQEGRGRYPERVLIFEGAISGGGVLDLEYHADHTQGGSASSRRRNSETQHSLPDREHLCLYRDRHQTK